MNTADRAKLQELLARCLDNCLQVAIEEEGILLPLFGDSSFHYMALAVINVIEALEDTQDYIARQLPDDYRQGLGI
jgi:hypothetical protein